MSTELCAHPSSWCYEFPVVFPKKPINPYALDSSPEENAKAGGCFLNHRLAHHQMATAYLSLGSNVGHREASINSALKMLGQEARILRVSSLYETEPVGYKDQPWFLNCVCALETDLSPRALLRLAKTIERNLGWKRTLRFGPRPIDIDILFYDSLVLDSPDLVIPHPRLVERAFVLIPLKEIAPNLVHPLSGLSIKELLERVENPEEVRLYSEFSNQ